MNICDRKVPVQGRCAVFARLDADDYQILDDPEPVLTELRESKLRIDIFTSCRKLPETAPKIAYPMEWDNMAVLNVTPLSNGGQSRSGSSAKQSQASREEGGCGRESLLTMHSRAESGRFTTSAQFVREGCFLTMERA